MNERVLAAFQDEMEKISEVEKDAFIGQAFKGVRRAFTRGSEAAGGGLGGFLSGARRAKTRLGVNLRPAQAWAQGVSVGDLNAARRASRSQQRATNVTNMRKNMGITDDVAGGAAGAAGPGFGATHFGTDLMQGKGGLGNWWQQASGAQKMKTLGAGVGAMGAYNLAQTGLGGRRSGGVQIG